MIYLGKNLLKNKIKLIINLFVRIIFIGDSGLKIGGVFIESIC